ncbi:hypothetical protein RhiirA1_401926 [Rhizophagus irregularis]|uniref:Uncharacterized protein n=1 Tax=Rhizophagus irregularis TaxID=588596 RepID=A0A2N0R077_9GLOM|nr:hypothetical protein RhiirA1_401926 [Rhizophagus irregularis]
MQDFQYLWARNLVQESGRAGRDGLPAKAIIMFSQKDIRTAMGVYMKGKESLISSDEGLEASAHIKYLSDAKNKIREVLFYCSNMYQCHKQAIVNYFAWPEDPLPQEYAQSDALKMLEVINVITKMEQQQQITRNNVVDVFRQSQAKDVKSRFGHLAVYQEKFTRKLKTKEDAFLLLDDLVLRKIVEEDIILNRTSTGQNYTCSIFVLGLVEDALAKIYSIFACLANLISMTK